MGLLWAHWLQVPKAVAAEWTLVADDASATPASAKGPNQRQVYKLERRDGKDVAAFEEEAVRKACMHLIQVWRRET